MIKEKEKVLCTIIVEINMKENIKMMKKMEKVYIYLRDIHMKENLKKV